MQKAYEIISTPEQWITGNMSAWRGEDGKFDLNAPNGMRNCYCALGAIRAKHGLLDSRSEEREEHIPYRVDVYKLARAVGPEALPFGEAEFAVTDWNDRVALSHTEVYTKLKGLDI